MEQGKYLSAPTNEGLPRKLTAVGTVGSLNQLFTVYEKNWNCPDCGQENYAARPRCLRCKKAKPENLDNYVMDPAAQAFQEGKEIEWQEVVDPATYQIYYYNTKTGVTQWDRPAEMGAAPTATGWFGRGQAGSMASQIFSELNKVYLSRPSRKQKEYVDPKKYTLQGAEEFNIWYGRYIGDLADKMDKEPATDRCHLETDAGYTKADLAPSDKQNRRYFCLHFARGMCAKGSECQFYHRIPTPEDDARTDELFDCFGRQRHNKHKDDMSGVGSFMKPCRTLFVGNLLKTKYDSPQQLEDTLWRHFGEWGELESLNVVHRLSIAFPRYRLRTSAEFAKEAMMCQALEHGEVLSIRWAHDDPNPVAKDSIQRADKDAMVALLKAKGVSLTAAGFNYPAEYQMPEPKRLRIEEGGSILEQYPELAYPNTDNQYQQYMSAYGASTSETGQQPTTSSTSSSSAIDKDKEGALARLGLFAGVSKPDSKGASEEKKATKEEADDEEQSDAEDDGEEEDEDEEEEDGEGGWKAHVDKKTGATYYFNSATGESSWTKPEGVDI